MRKKSIYLLLLTLINIHSLFAQNLSVNGVIVDKKTNEPLIGASVMQKGTQKGTQNIVLNTKVQNTKVQNIQNVIN